MKTKPKFFHVDDVAGTWLVIITDNARVNLGPWAPASFESEQLKRNTQRYNGETPGHG